MFLSCLLATFFIPQHDTNFVYAHHTQRAINPLFEVDLCVHMQIFYRFLNLISSNLSINRRHVMIRENHRMFAKVICDIINKCGRQNHNNYFHQQSHYKCLIASLHHIHPDDYTSDLKIFKRIKVFHAEKYI